MFTKTIRKAAVLAAAAALMLTGCQSAVQQQQQQATASATGAPTKGGIAVLAQNADPQLTAILAQRAGNGNWIMNVYEPLLRYDKDGKAQPVLAKSWVWSADGLTLDLELLDGVKYHSGRTFTADDVVFTLGEVAKPANNSQLRFMAENVASATAVSPTKAQIKLKAPMANFLDLLDFTPMIDKDTWATVKDGQKVVGTGPFEWDKWSPGAEITLKRYEAHRDPAYLDGISLPIITDPTAQMNAIRGGRVMFSSVLTPSDASTFKGDAKFVLLETAGSSVPLGVNVTMAPFDKKEVRQALGYAIDRDRIANQVFAGAVRKTQLYWGATDSFDKSLDNKYTYDPAKAKQMIEAAGAAGASIEISLPNYAPQQSTYEIVRNNLEAVGFKVTSKIYNSTDYNAKLAEGNLGQAFITTHGAGFSAGVRLNSLPTLREKTNISKMTEAQYTTLRTNLFTAKGEAESKKALDALTTYMLDEAFTLVLVDQNNVNVFAANFKGTTFSVTNQVICGKAYLVK